MTLHRLFVIVLAFMIFFVGSYGSVAEDLQQLFDDYWAAQMKENPFSATGSGVGLRFSCAWL